MTTYQRYIDFTAQSRTLSALMSLYAQLENEHRTDVELTPIVVFTAFAIEGYLNSIGARKIAFWDELERLPWRQKVEILHKNGNAKADWGCDPLQFASEVFGLRDKLAHGKAERVVGPISVEPPDLERGCPSPDLQPDWYGDITIEWVMKAQDRFKVLMTYLGHLYGFHESDHLHSASGGLLTNDQADA